MFLIGPGVAREKSWVKYENTNYKKLKTNLLYSLERNLEKVFATPGWWAKSISEILI